jgi:GTP-binding protein
MKNKPIVTIVGRPNVGKSTIFNRIIRRREAITDNMPGVTRDRNYAEAEWAGNLFTLIDTGGYLPDSEDVIAQGVFRQVEGAIAEADGIIFLVDAQMGITGVDQEIGKLLIRTEKPVLLVVNKVDNTNNELNIAEFFSLGLGDPVPVSALSGRNMGDFLDEVIKLLPPNSAVADLEAAENDPRVKLAVVGRPNVGKSSLVNAYLGYEKQIVTEIPGTTRDAIDSVLKYYGQEFVLIDTAGIRRRSRVKESIEYYSVIRSLESIHRCDVAMVLIDAVEGLTDQDKKIIEEVITHKKGLILAVNKWDMFEKETNSARQYELNLRKGLRGEKFVPIIFISVFEKQRLFKMLDLVKTIHEERHKRIQTSDLNEFIRRTVDAYPPSDFAGKHVKINYCTQVKTAPPVFTFFMNFPEAIKPNYRKYLENKLREEYGFFGVPLTLTFKRK